MKKLLFLFALILNINANAQLCFNIDSAFTTGSWITTLVISADFNGDNNADLAVGTNNGAVQILLGTGTGNFGVGTNCCSTGGGIASIASADFNADGFADIAFADGKLYVSLGDGLGGFGIKTYFSIPGFNGAKFITSGDFDNDGKIDLAVTNTNASSVSILIGNGNGSFVASTNLFTTSYTPSSIVCADFNSDGNMDLATSNVSSGSVINYVNVLLGDGIGNFGTAKSFTVGNTPRSIISADFNGDGKFDLATANEGPSSVSVLLGTGTGSFTGTTYGTGWAPYSVTSGDFDGDGILDLATANQSADNVSVLKGTGNGSFGFRINFPTGVSPYSITNKDFNKDGKTDLVTVNQNSKAWLLLNCTPCVVSVTDSIFKDVLPLTWNLVPIYSSNITSAKWSWGDGTDTIAMYPSHVYATAGYYNICVTAYASCGDSATYCRNDSIYKTDNSNAMIKVNIIPKSVVTVKELNRYDRQIFVYPNPATNALTITNIGSKSIIRLYDALGKLVIEKETESNLTVDVNNLTQGVYTLITESTNSRAFNKVIITK